jgi:hypothetical protein
MKSKHVAAFEGQHLQTGESVVTWIGAWLREGGPFPGALIVTTSRVAYYRKGFFSEALQTMPLRAVTSIERVSGMKTRNRIRIVAAGDDLDVLLSHKGNMHHVAAAIEQGRDRVAS